MNREEKQVIVLTTTSHFLVHLFEGVLPPLIPLLIMEFSTDYFHLGLVVTIFSYAFGIGSLPAGFLADKIGPGKLITFFLFGGGIFAIAVWPAGTLIHYSILMGGLGLFCSTYHPAANTLISLGVREKGKAFGIAGVWAMVSTFPSPSGSAPRQRQSQAILPTISDSSPSFMPWPAALPCRQPWPLSCSSGSAKSISEPCSLSGLIYLSMESTHKGWRYKIFLIFRGDLLETIYAGFMEKHFPACS